MKNIFLLPTDKPSRLFKFANELHLDTIPKDYYKKYNIYITSDEEPKIGEWVIKISSLYKGGGIAQKYSFIDTQFEDITFKKIILTTDLELIADGIQAIGNEFLEWFVKNSSCEFVKTELLNVSEVLWEEYFKKHGVYPKYPYYEKIIIPQEEPKLCEGDLNFLGMVTPATEEYECIICRQKYRYTSTTGRNVFPLTRCTNGISKQEPKTGSLGESIQEVTKDLLREINELKQETLEEIPKELEPILAKISHINDLGLSQWYEVVYYADDKWCSYSDSKTFEDGERVIDWKYCKEQLKKKA
jgi:hypothetical protein